MGAPQQQAGEYAEQQQVADEFQVDELKGLGRIGLKDVLQHVAVDGDAVTVHEVGRGGIAQQEQGQQRAKQIGQGDQA